MRLRNFLLCVMVVTTVLAGCMPIRGSLPWVADEIVFFGAKEDIHNLLLELPENARALLDTDLNNPQPEAEFDLTILVRELLARTPTDQGLRDVFLGFFGGRPLPIQLEQKIVAQRYRFTKNFSLNMRIDILQFIKYVDEVRGQPQAGDPFPYFKFFVFAEPNFWLTSLQGGKDDVKPCLSLSAQPNSFGNGPFGIPKDSLDQSPAFNDQWAFQILAGHPATSTQADPLKNNVLGADPHSTDVVIFDNSPFTDVAEIPTGTITPEDRLIKMDPTETLTLHVLHWTLGLTPITPTQAISRSDEHGVFIASLIHKVSPSSSISLVRILDPQGCGVAYALNNAIAEFAQRVSPDQRVVFNLSLGAPRSNIELLPRMYLEVLLANDLATKQIIVVAAAGNDHGAPLLLPAGYVDDPAYAPYVKVIAVEASNENGGRACFSNKGININGDRFSDHAILAPGGEGDSPPSSCLPDLPISCTTTSPPVCLHAIRGIRHDGNYMFWSGTSFATPLVSGAAARWLSQGCSMPKVINHLTASPQLTLTSLSCP